MGSVPFQRSYTNFQVGLNLQMPPVLPDSEEVMSVADICENWIPTENGLLKAPGFAAVLETAIGEPVTSLFTYRNPSGVNELIACAGTQIYTISGDTASSILTGQTDGAHYQATYWADNSGNGVLILCNGVDTPVYYDGTTCEAITFTDPDDIWNDATPYGAAVFRGRIFFWDDETVYTPKPGTYDDFDTSTSEADAFNVDPGFGGFITGLKALTDNFLVIYKESCIRRLSGVSPFGTVGTEPFEIAMVTDDFGCIAPGTIIQVGLDHYFLSEDGVRQLRPIQSYGDIDPTQPSYPIQSIINGLNITSRSVIRNACTVFDRDSRIIWFSVPNGSNSSNNLIIGYNVVTKGLHTRPDGDIAATALVYHDRKIYHGDSTGQVYLHGNANGNNGSAMNGVWESKWIAHQGLGTRKRYKDLFIYADSDGAGDVVVQWRLLRRGKNQDRTSTESIGSGNNTWDNADWDEAVWSSGEQSVFHIKNLGRGNAIKLRLLNTSATQRVKIRQIDLMGESFGRALG